MASTTGTSTLPWVVALCAEWCGQCRGYRKVFEEIAYVHTSLAQFYWVDVEDEDDIAGDLDIQTFPTLLVKHGASLRFYGPLTTQPGVLDRVIQSAVKPDSPIVVSPPGTDALLAALRGDPLRLSSLRVGSADSA